MTRGGAGGGGGSLRKSRGASPLGKKGFSVSSSPRELFLGVEEREEEELVARDMEGKGDGEEDEEDYRDDEEEGGDEEGLIIGMGGGGRRMERGR